MKYFLSTALLWVMCCFGALAGSIIDVSNTSVTSGDGWTYADGIFTVAAGADVTVTGSTTSNRVVVAHGATATVTLYNATIDVSDMANACAFSIANANVTVKLSGSNTLRSNGYAAGLQANAGATLTVMSASRDNSKAGSLQAVGGTVSATNGGAGIGSNNGGAGGGRAGSITIKGGTVTANGGGGSPGIGGRGGSISIIGGEVNATGASHAAGIGSGYNTGNAGNIAISGGEVTARGNNYGAGIGSGGATKSNADSGTVTITGGAVFASSGGTPYGSGGGSSIGSGGWEREGSKSSSVSVSISGGTILLHGGTSGITFSDAPVVFGTHSPSSNPSSGIMAIGDDAVGISWEDRTVALNTHFTVPDGVTLTIPTGWTFVSTADKVFTNNGEIINNGALAGPLANNSAIINYGAMTPLLAIYTVSFAMNGHGIKPNDLTHIVSGSRLKTIKPQDPTATRYIFGGWYKESTCTTPWDMDNSPVTSNVTLYAKWLGTPHSIIFNSNGGTGSMHNLTINFDETKSLPKNSFTRSNYNFIGWNTNQIATSALYGDGSRYMLKTDADVTLYAIWAQQNYGINFNANGGSITHMPVTANSTITLPKNIFTKTGYSFAGWATSANGNVVYTDNALYTQPVNNQTLYANWSGNTTAITLIGNGGSSDGAATAVYGSATLTTFDAPARTGYTLTGYFTDVLGGKMVIKADNALVPNVSGYTDANGLWARDERTSILHAQWTPNTTTIILNPDSKKMKTSILATYDSGSLPSFTALTQRGHTLTGYFTSATGGVKVINATGTLTANATDYTDVSGKWTRDKRTLNLHAQWIPNTTIITLDKNGGIANGLAKATYDSESLTTFTAPTRTGYTLTGYFTLATDGVKVINASGTLALSHRRWDKIESALTLYAQWAPNTTAITLSANGGKANGSITTAKYDNSFLTPFTALTRKGYTLTGYFTLATGGVKVISASGTLAYNVSGYTDASSKWTRDERTLNLHAQWIPNATAILLDKNGGIANGSTKATYDSESLTAFTALARTGYTLTGYFTTATGGAKVINTNGTLVTNGGKWARTESALTFYAHWSPNTTAITLAANGKGLDGSAKVTYDSKSLTAFTALTRTGYTAIGYFTLATGGVKVINANGTLVPSVSGYTNAGGLWVRDESTLTLHVQWVPNTTEITLDKNGGAVNGSATAVYDNTLLTAFKDPVQTGYTPTGYFTLATGGVKVINTDGTFVQNDGIWTRTESALTFYTQWSPSTTTITLNKNRGAADGSVMATYDDKSLTTFTALTRTGYALTGYFTSATGGVKVINTNGTLIPSVSGYTNADGLWARANKMLTLYAQWLPNSIAITLDKNDGTTDGSATAAYESASLTTFTEPTRTGYSPIGYFSARVGGEMVINANGTFVPGVSGYTNANGLWMIDTSSAINTLYTQWTPNKTTITLNRNGKGSHDRNLTGSVTATYDSYSLPPFTALTQTGYTLTGYFTLAMDGAKVINADGTLVANVNGYTDENGKWVRKIATDTLHAQWSPNTTTVTLVRNGARVDGSATATYGSPTLAEFNAPTRTGYTLTGFFTAAVGGEMVANTNSTLVPNVSGYTNAGSLWIIDTDTTVTLYAQWSPSTTAITLVANGGSMNSSVTATYDSELLPAFAELTRTGYTLAGYFTAAANGEIAINAAGALVPNANGYTNTDGLWMITTGAVTLYAQWIPNRTTIALAKNGGSIDGSATAVYDATLTGFNASTRIGHTLTGYFTATSGGKMVIGADSALVPNVDGYTSADGKWVKDEKTLMLHTQWTPNITAITLDKNGGLHDGSATATYGSESLSAFAAQTQTGYAVTGYFTAASGGVMIISADGTLISGLNGYTDTDGKWIKDIATLTLYTQWTDKTAITLVGNNEGPNGSTTATYDNSLPRFNAMTWTGHTLRGYFTSDSSGVRVINADGTLAPNVNGYTSADGTWKKEAATLTLYAQWSKNTTAIMLSGNGGSMNDLTTATYDRAELPPFEPLTRTGYTLIGYFSAAPNGKMVIDTIGALIPGVSGYTNADGKWTRDERTLTLYAQWATNTTVITLDKNGGHLDGSATATYSSATLLPFAPLTRTGYALTGYFSAAEDGKMVVKADGTITPGVSAYTDADGRWARDERMLTLYAQWLPSTVIMLNANGGELNGSVIAMLGSETMTAFTAPTCKDYTPVGYFTKSFGGTMVITANGTLVSGVSGYTDADGKWTKDTADFTLYTQWQPREKGILKKFVDTVMSSIFH
jgi:uncharacterized repeat protein (TIGR02543 family)